MTCFLKPKNFKFILLLAFFFGVSPSVLSLPASASLISPTADITTSNPTYTWNAVLNSTHYYLWVNDSSGNIIKKWYRADIVGCSSGTGTCTITPTTALLDGLGSWWVQAWNSSGYGYWSAQMDFNLSTPLPPIATTPLSPTGTISDNTLRYTWEAIANATYYYLWADDSNGNNIIKKWYSAESVGCSSGTGNCTVTPIIAHVDGSYTWWVRTWNDNGYGPWSAGLNYILDTTPPPSGSLLWNKHIASSPLDYLDTAESVATDSAGNVYVAGRTRGSLFGEVNSGHYDAVYLVKYDNDGSELWHKWLSTNTDFFSFYNTVDSITTDNEDNVYLARHTSGSLFNEINQGAQDAYIVKYSSSGIKLWHKWLASNTNDQVKVLSSDSANNIYVAGHTEGSLFGETSSVTGNDYIVKYNSSGAKLWHKWFDSTLTINDISIDSTSNVYLTGSATNDYLIIKYKSDGTELWQKNAPYGIAKNISLNNTGEVLLAIETSNLLFGEVNPSFRTDLYLVKYDTNGNKLWHHRFSYPNHSNDHYRASAITTDSLNNIYLSFDSYDYDGMGGSSKGYIYKFDNSGVPIWMKDTGSTFVATNDLAVDPSGDIYLTGHKGNDGFLNKYQH